jgi:hypothetical protein
MGELRFPDPRVTWYRTDNMPAPSMRPYVQVRSPADTKFLLANNECMDCHATFNLNVVRRNRKKVVLCSDCVKATVPATRRKGKPMSRRNQPVIVNAKAPDNTVEAIENLRKGGRYVSRGMRLDRNDVMVLEAPMSFQVRYRLDTEVVDPNTDAEQRESAA